MVRDELGLPVGVPVGMKWFRSNIKHGARLALLALALQFGLSFGHFHAATAPAAASIESVAAQSDIIAALAPPDTADQSAALPASHDDSDHHPREHCAICAVIAHAKSVLFAPPPDLLIPQAIALLSQTTDAAFVDLNPVSVAFQPRAPPAS